MKKIFKRYGVFALILTIALASIALWIIGVAADVQSLERLSSLIGALGVLATLAWYVLSFRQEKKNDSLRFLIDLQQKFLGDKDVFSVYGKLERNVKLNMVKDRMGIQKYLSYFDFVCMLLEDNSASLEDIDAIFSYYLFAVANNVQIQDTYFFSYSIYYEKFFKLYRTFERFHAENGLPTIPKNYKNTRNLSDFIKENKLPY